MSAAYELVRLANGSFSVRSTIDGEIFHPVAGPVAEAEALYVRQLRLRERATCRQHPAGENPERQRDAGGTFDEFVIWDVGLGAGGNALTAIRNLSDLKVRLRIVSFDRTLEALSFALQHGHELQFPLGWENEISQLLAKRSVEFDRGSLRARWEVHIGDFPEFIALSARDGKAPAPHAIFFDAFSPARNPEMWTLPLFENLFRCLDPQRPGSLATFSRSTMSRVALLLGGFFVGAGHAIAGKEETTIAANALELIDRPLDTRWLERARRSHNAEPLDAEVYRTAPLSEKTWRELQAHPQFANPTPPALPEGLP